MDVEFGNAATVETGGTGWFVGFSDWTRPGAGGPVALRHVPADVRSHTLSMKWMHHAPGDPRGEGKPVSEGRTLSILVSEHGGFRLQCCPRADFAEGVVEHVLRRHGDFVAWGEGVHHRYEVAAPSTILTLRWIPDAPATGA